MWESTLKCRIRVALRRGMAALLAFENLFSSQVKSCVGKDCCSVISYGSKVLEELVVVCYIS